jgi:hypothetical protein
MSLVSFTAINGSREEQGSIEYSIPCEHGRRHYWTADSSSKWFILLNGWGMSRGAVLQGFVIFIFEE